MEITITVEDHRIDPKHRLILELRGESPPQTEALVQELVTHLTDLLVCHGYPVTRQLDGEEVTLTPA
jgi:hypothetical protein